MIAERLQVPKGKNIFPAFWAMRRKRDFITGKISKYKSETQCAWRKTILWSGLF